MVCSDRAGRIRHTRIWRRDQATPAEECGYGDRSSWGGVVTPRASVTKVAKLQGYNGAATHRVNHFNFVTFVTLLTMELLLERLYRFGLRDFFAAVFAGAPRIIVPKIEHRLTKVFNDVAAVEIDVFH